MEYYVKITKVDNESQAEKLGIKVGDILTNLAGQSVNTMGQFKDIIAQKKTEQHFKASLIITRKNQLKTFIFDLSKPLGIIGDDFKFESNKTKEEKILDNEIKSKIREFPANFEDYKNFTLENNWKGICELNEINLDSFGTKKELNVLVDYLEKEEVVFALTSGVMSQTSTSNAFDWGANTWLVVLTNERFLFLDHALMSQSVDTQSIRHNSVQAVSASQGIMLGKIQVDLGSRVVIVDNCNKESVKVMASLANKWLRELQREKKNHLSEIPTEFFSQIQESITLARIQIKNQEKIITLLEQIKDKKFPT